jgi:branched-subunit amino acid aminotransferase/4-amino-4-deoxychorismate lyase
LSVASPLAGEARPVRIELTGDVSAAQACLLLRGDSHPVALTGAWAGGGAVVASEPVRVGGRDEDPFALLDEQPPVGGVAVGHHEPPRVEGDDDPFALHDEQPAVSPVGGGDHWRPRVEGDDLLCGGWFGYLGYGLGARLEAVPPPPPRPIPLPPFALAFYDHLLRLDSQGRWWFEALWTDERADVLERRLAELRSRLAAGVRARPVRVGDFEPPGPGSAGHPAAVEECRERIAARDILHANVSVRLEAGWEGDPLDLFARTAGALQPRHGALVAGPWGSICSLSPELFLRRRDRRVADVVRASFPPGSVTGAPKIQAMRVIAELESSGREAYTGAIGYASPVGGLELGVAIRTLEARGERIWLGVGGAVVADSDPERRLEECVATARPVIEAAGGRLVGHEPLRRTASAGRGVGRLMYRDGYKKRPTLSAARADRPDPALGVFSTLLVRDGVPVDSAAHIGRLERSADELYGQALPDDLDARIEAAARHSLQRVRVLVRPGPGRHATVELDARPLDAEPAPEPEVLSPAYLPGGLGAHKWSDRRLLEELARTTGALPLIVDLDDEALEAATANVWIVEGTALVTPPLDGRLLPGTVRARVLEVAAGAGVDAREEPIPLDRLAGADEVLLSSAIKGVRPAALPEAKRPRFEVGARLRAALREPALVEAR